MKDRAIDSSMGEPSIMLSTADVDKLIESLLFITFAGALVGPTHVHSHRPRRAQRAVDRKSSIGKLNLIAVHRWSYILVNQSRIHTPAEPAVLSLASHADDWVDNLGSVHACLSIRHLFLVG